MLSTLYCWLYDFLNFHCCLKHIKLLYYKQCGLHVSINCFNYA
jgi:hypothetical protein